MEKERFATAPERDRTKDKPLKVFQFVPMRGAKESHPACVRCRGCVFSKGKTHCSALRKEFGNPDGVRPYVGCSEWTRPDGRWGRFEAIR